MSEEVSKAPWRAKRTFSGPGGRTSVTSTAGGKERYIDNGRVITRSGSKLLRPKTTIVAPDKYPKPGLANRVLGAPQPKSNTTKIVIGGGLTNGARNGLAGAAVATAAGAAYVVTRNKKKKATEATVAKSAFGVIHKDRKKDAAYAGGGAVAGAALMPVRTTNNSKGNAYAKLPEGVHNVPTETVLRHARRTGPRFQNRRYTAGMANHLERQDKLGKPVEPSKVVVWRDGSSTQIDGAHRIWARSMLGQKTMPIQVHHEKGRRPDSRRALHHVAAELQTKYQRKVMRRDYNGGKGLSAGKRKKLESQLHPWARKYNMKYASTGHVDPKKAAEKAHKPSAAYAGRPLKQLRGTQAAYIAGGAAAAYGGHKLYDKAKSELKKSNTVSAFGIAHD